ncbi:hypothetical protein [Fontibacillus sp. BL9]|uniref:hypothetical protein n=1 Tax=Fontibacillus sp. BL9 TaxID=3389971 RepID=UPI00397E848D
MTMKRHGSIIAFVLYLVAVVSTLTVYITLHDGFTYSPSFWISLVAIILAETALWIYVRYWINQPDKVKRIIPGYLAMGIVILAYLTAVLCYSFFAGIADLALRWFMLLHVLTCAAAIIVGGAILLFLKYANADESDTRSQIVNLHTIESALKELLLKVQSRNEPQNEEMKSIITKLIEKVHYSDPVMPSDIQYLDQQLLYQIQLIHEEMISRAEGVQDPSPEDMLQRLQDIQHHLTLRNEQLLLTK